MSNRLVPIQQFPRKLRDPAKALRSFRSDKEENVIRRGNKMALKLFKVMSQRVPAYKDFLKKNKIKPNNVKTVKDLKQVPTVDKKNYLKKYSLSDLCWDGKLDSKWWIFSSTSGSTGEPFYFPRDDFEDWEYAAVAEIYLLNHYEIDKKSTLYVNGFAMGAWIGGLFTYQAIKNIADRGKYRIGIVNPGLNKEGILKAIEKIGPYYDQVIIGGYPPFTKDVIDYGTHLKFPWRKFNIKFVFSAEGFSEEFRDYVLKKVGAKNVYKDSLNHYGTVDLGTMSHETPVSILARRLAIKNKNLYKDLFKQNEKLPTLTQYIPELFYFEVESKEDLVCTSLSGIPLVRYDLKDHGGLTTFKDLKKIFSQNGVDLEKESKKSDISKTILDLPFLYVYERSDFSVSLFGANIYPENIRSALQKRILASKVTGKFTMLVSHNKNYTPFLEINIEMKKGINKTRFLEESLKETIIKTLLRDNSEYKSNYSQFADRMVPKILLWKHEDPKYFNLSGKQRWVIK